MATAAASGPPSKSATTSLEEYMRVQQDLVREASLALPHSFSQCTYSLGYIRCATSSSQTQQSLTFHSDSPSTPRTNFAYFMNASPDPTPCLF